MKTFTILIVALCTVSTVRAQDIDISSKSAKVRIGDVDISITRPPFMQGDWELSMTGSVGRTTSNASYSLGSYNSTSETSVQYVFLSLCAGYYIIDRLSIEPEISLIANKIQKPAQSILLNLSYTQPLTNSDIAIFIRGGFGLGNGSTVLMDGAAIRQTTIDGFDMKTVNAGAGVKFLISQGAALRIELNYRQQTFSEEWAVGPNSSIKTEYKDSVIRCCLGFSVLL